MGYGGLNLYYKILDQAAVQKFLAVPKLQDCVKLLFQSFHLKHVVILYLKVNHIFSDCRITRLYFSDINRLNNICKIPTL